MHSVKRFISQLIRKLLARLIVLHDGAHMEMVFRFVTYPEDGLCVAHCLELDIIGVGSTTKEAIAELETNIDAQLSFAHFKGIDPMRPAPKEVQDLWTRTNMAAFWAPREGEKRQKKDAPSKEKPKKAHSTADVLRWNTRSIAQTSSFEHCAH
jgi:hypothetical protein